MESEADEKKKAFALLVIVIATLLALAVFLGFTTGILEAFGQSASFLTGVAETFT